MTTFPAPSPTAAVRYALDVVAEVAAAMVYAYGNSNGGMAALELARLLGIWGRKDTMMPPRAPSDLSL
eukprot:gene23755-20466_t